MAVIQYGAIVTEIKGSLGGHTFKSQRGTKVIMNKSAGFSRSKQLSNRALSYAGFIFASWTQLPEDARQVWTNAAALLLLPDKYGNLVHISGRELFTKCNLNLGSGYFIERPSDGFSNYVAPFQLSDGFIGVAPNSATIDMTRFFGGNVWYDVTAEVSVNKLNAPVFRTRALLKRFGKEDSGELDFTTEFFQKFPYVLGGYYVRIYVTPINGNGLKGVTQYYDTIVNLELPVYELLSADIFGVGAITNLQLDNLYNSGWSIFVWAEYSTVDYPEENFNTATPIGAYVPQAGNVLNLDADLLIAFPSLATDDYVRFYTKLYLDGTSFGFPQSVTARVIGVAPEFFLTSLIVGDGGNDSLLGFAMNSPEGYSFTIYAKASESGYPDEGLEGSSYLNDLPLDVFNPLPLGGLMLSTFPTIEVGWYVRVFAILTLGSEDISLPSSITTIVT